MTIIAKSEIKYVVIAICTYKREMQLERLLNSLICMNYQKNIKTTILIVDNDNSESARKIFEIFQDKLNVKYIVEGRKGLSNVRNKALETAINIGASHIAFIDDDETADKNWLLNHIDFYNNFSEFYISSGPTIKIFDKEYPKYITKNRIFRTRNNKKLGSIRKVCASGNVFFPINIVVENSVYFDEKYNFSGSEDTDFFGKLKELGYEIGWNSNAVNYEVVSSERANLKWIFERSYHSGHIVSLLKFPNNKISLKKLVFII